MPTENPELFRSELHAFYMDHLADIIASPEELPPLPNLNLTQSEYMNAFLSMVLLRYQGGIEKDKFRKVFLKELHRFFSCYNQFMKSYNPDQMSEDTLEFANMVRSSFADQELALAYIVQYFKTDNIGYLSDALVDSTFAVNSIFNSWESFIDRSIPSIARTCSNCDEPLNFTDLNCSNCGELAILGIEESGLEFAAIRLYLYSSGIFEKSPFPGCIIEIYDAFNMLIANEITLEAFTEKLDWIDAQYDRAIDILKRQTKVIDNDSLLQKFFMVITGGMNIRSFLEKIRFDVLTGENEKIKSYWPNLLLELKRIYKGYEPD